MRDDAIIHSITLEPIVWFLTFKMARTEPNFAGISLYNSSPRNSIFQIWLQLNQMDSAMF